MEYKMPLNLFGSNNAQDDNTYQHEDGSLVWQGRYKLKNTAADREMLRYTSTH
jgi:hypothetical protein